jgi:hypothetical protein
MNNERDILNAIECIKEKKYFTGVGEIIGLLFCKNNGLIATVKEHENRHLLEITIPAHPDTFNKDKYCLTFYQICRYNTVSNRYESEGYGYWFG